MSYLLIISDPSPVSQTRIASLLKRPLSIKCPRSVDATTTSESAAWKASNTKKPWSVLNITERQRTQRTTYTRSIKVPWKDQNQSCCPCLNTNTKRTQLWLHMSVFKKVVLQCISTSSKYVQIAPSRTSMHFKISKVCRRERFSGSGRNWLRVRGNGLEVGPSSADSAGSPWRWSSGCRCCLAADRSRGGSGAFGGLEWAGSDLPFFGLVCAGKGWKSVHSPDLAWSCMLFLGSTNMGLVFLLASFRDWHGTQ